jgi:hypothetical protein
VRAHWYRQPAALSRSAAASIPSREPAASAAAEPALVVGAAGLLALIGVRSVIGPAPDGGPAPARVLKTNASVIALPVITLLPAVALLVVGTVTHDVAVRWLAVPVGLAWGVFLCWRSVRLAQQRLESHGPEIFARVLAPAS